MAIHIFIICLVVLGLQNIISITIHKKRFSKQVDELQKQLDEKKEESELVMRETMGKILFSSESVTEGHPDKICDQISDAILDAMLAQDPMSRVACETAITTDLVLVMGEITSNATVDIEAIVRDTICKIGYAVFRGVGNESKLYG